MATFAKIKPDQAPSPFPGTGGNRIAARMRLFEGYLEAVGKDEVGELTPDQGAGETTRGLSMRVHRASTRLGGKATTWVRGRDCLLPVQTRG